MLKITKNILFYVVIHGCHFQYRGNKTSGIMASTQADQDQRRMEHAHTRLIEQLTQRFAATDNTPLYLKFAETVKNAVRSGTLEHGNILPGERDLSQLAGVSRITVRKAMQTLEEEGVVTRVRGYGTQINNIFEYSLKEARGFSQQVVLRGKKPNTLWVNKQIVKSSKEVAEQLAIAPDTPVFLLKRIRYVDEDAVSIEESYVPVDLIADADDIGVSLYDYFRSQNINPQRTRSRVSARMPDAEFQSHIQLDNKVPVLVIKQIALDPQNRPIEYSISYCRSDLYVFICEE
ncbi:GntR family transcriptional regulator [Pectobacterium carotovorum subsp. carotovorum]|nr:GntR family transcriptional regulator [Pectobacterium carotovorum subsp. carotovorum]